MKKINYTPIIAIFTIVLTSLSILPIKPYTILEYNQPQAELYVGASANPNIYDPFNVTCAYKPCDNFTVYVKAKNISDLLSMDFYMNFSPAFLEVLNDTPGVPNVWYGASWGTVLVHYIGVAGTINNTIGLIDGYTAARIVGTISGNLTLFSVKFHMKDWGETLLQITDTPTIMLNSTEQKILCPITDGRLSCPPHIPPTFYTLTIFVTIGGTTNPSPGKHTYAKGTVVQVLATPFADYVFGHWMLNGIGNTSNPITVKMDTNHTLQAFFTYKPPVFITPINKTINVTTGENFKLIYKFNFSQPERGFFATTISWDNNETDPTAPYWNFTYIGFVAKFTDGTSFWGPVTATVWKAVPPSYPSGYYRYSVTISESYGESKNGEFWVNVTMRAAGQSGGSYINHTAPADHNITISSTFVVEAALVTFPDGVCTIHVKSLLIHDVAIVRVSLFRTIVGEDIITAFIEIYVVAENQGNLTETFDVIVYRDSRIAMIRYDVALPAGANTTLTFAWNTFGIQKGQYTIKAEATKVPGELDLADNTLPDGTIIVTIPGDATGDGTVGIRDLTKLALSWHKARGDPQYDPNADFNCDGIVDIRDLTTLAKNWMKSDP